MMISFVKYFDKVIKTTGYYIVNLAWALYIYLEGCTFDSFGQFYTYSL